MRGWVGALRRYSEPSCSLQGEGRNNVGCRYDSPHQTRKEEKQVRKKEGNPRLSTELVLPGDVGMCLPQQGHSWEGCGYCPGWGTHWSLKQLVFLVYSASGVQTAPERFRGRATTELCSTRESKGNSGIGGLRLSWPRAQSHHPAASPLPGHPNLPQGTLRLSLRSW